MCQGSGTDSQASSWLAKVASKCAAGRNKTHMLATGTLLVLQGRRLRLSGVKRPFMGLVAAYKSGDGKVGNHSQV
eukprot:CAMPEP_0185598764 /NCGR_PEP_ID=MMETSP0434-20130131/82225_1 /TAXON_ID=626734 ORGANISM="Favella taraikaensis, Strain Fe Narragansett Bay" /NCGR_SAMPLE_ID=MMETSP0434 /ASSEMBLY_ACC=CAM_ASM_000379 /LENGTH=74 /DNA_ID=CAMNT_0028227879 /DNA_START=678 /DNA_END=902 /DNA_ORIENTATION=+